MARAFIRRKWVLFTAVGVGLAGSVLWLLGQRTTTVYVSTARLVSSEKSQSESKEIIPQYLYSPGPERESKMGRVAADIFSLDFLRGVAERTGITYVVLKQKGRLSLMDFRARGIEKPGRFRIDVEKGGSFRITGPGGTAPGKTGEPFEGLGLSFTLLSPQPRQGDFMELSVFPPGDMAGIIKGAINLDISELGQGLGRIKMGGEAAFSGPMVMSITVTWSDPVGARLLASGIAEAAVQENLRRKRAQFAQSKDFIRKQMDSYSQELARIAEDMRQFKESEGISDISEQEANIVSRLSDMDARIASIQIQERYLSRINAWVQGTDTLPGYAEFLIDDPRIAALFGQARDISVRLASMTRDLGESHPDVRAARSQLAGVEEELAKAIAERKKALSMERAEIETQLAREKAKLGDLMEKELRYIQLERQREAAEDIYTLLTQKYEEIRINEAGVTPDITVLEKPSGARTVTRKPRFVRVPLMGILIGLLVGVGLVMILEYADTTVGEEDDVTKRAGLRVLATIPTIETAKGAFSVVPTDKESLEAMLKKGPSVMESFRMLALNLGLLSPQKTNRTLCVTSPVAGEGKTTVSANLAMSLAAAGEKVLLVDADARVKALTEMFGLAGKKGFFDILANGTPPEDVMVQGSLDGLFIVPIGERFHDPVSLLRGEALSGFIRKTEASFDVVIFDMPPALLLTEVGILAPRADATVLVARVHHSDVRDIRRASELLTGAGARLVGVVLNMAKNKRSSYYHEGGRQKRWWKRR